MSSSEIGRLDSKGRLIIPSGLRDYLRLKPGSQVLVSLDEERFQIIITPASEKKLVLMKIGLCDNPGSLAAAAKVLASEGVDLVSTESRSLSRGKTAEWRVVCSAGSVKDFAGLKKKLLKAGTTGFSAHHI
jgi:AbrB family looped-hinge helix DNA binding protein